MESQTAEEKFHKEMRRWKSENRLMKEALEKWGVESQLNMVVEECAELIDALQKRKRNRVSDDDVLEEGVDVELCIGQLKLILNNDVRWEHIRRQKLERLQKLLEDGQPSSMADYDVRE